MPRCLVPSWSPSAGAHRLGRLVGVPGPVRAGIEIEDYQLLTLVKALHIPRVTTLIADDAGLSNTIEAGLDTDGGTHLGGGPDATRQGQPSLFSELETGMTWVVVGALLGATGLVLSQRGHVQAVPAAPSSRSCSYRCWLVPNRSEQIRAEFLLLALGSKRHYSDLFEDALLNQQFEVLAQSLW